MLYLDHTSTTWASNVALDEWLLREASEGRLPGDVLRIWEPGSSGVILGRGSRAAQEIDQEACQRDQIAVVRRCSGGASVVGGPGCLMYALVLGPQHFPAGRRIPDAHRLVLDRMAQSLAQDGHVVRRQGTSDLTWGDGPHPRKCSGNSLRWSRSHVLYHGTLLYDFDVQPVGRWLAHPPREPDYRQGRTHSEFLGNLGLAVGRIRDMLVQCWQADTELSPPTPDRLAELIQTRYENPDWTWCL